MIHDVLLLMNTKRLQGSLRHGRTVVGEGSMVAAEYLSIYLSRSVYLYIYLYIYISMIY